MQIRGDICGYGFEEEKQNLKNKKDKSKPGKIGYVVNTCNNDTYVLELEDFFVIQTCMNHSFEDNLNGQCFEYSDSLIKELEQIGCDCIQNDLVNSAAWLHAKDVYVG